MASQKAEIVSETRTVVVPIGILGKYVADAILEGWNVTQSMPDGTRDRAARVSLVRDTPLA